MGRGSSCSDEEYEAAVAAALEEAAKGTPAEEQTARGLESLRTLLGGDSKTSPEQLRSYEALLLDNTDAAALDKERCAAVAVLFDTERSHLSELQLIRNEFLVPMKERRLLAPEELAMVFSNFEYVLALSEAIVTSREHVTASAVHGIGDMFERAAGQLTAVEFYSSSLRRSLAALAASTKAHKSVSKFLAQAGTSSGCGGRSLPKLLRKPAERCQAYPRLLQGVLDKTHDAHPDLATLSVAVAMVEDASANVSRNLARLDSQLKLAELEQKADGVGKLIEQGRELYWDGMALVQTGSGKNQERVIYVLDTCMLIMTVGKPKQRQKLKAKLLLDQLNVQDVPSTGGFSHRIELQDLDTKVLRRITCKTAMLKKSLLERLSEATLDLAHRNSHGLSTMPPDPKSKKSPRSSKHKSKEELPRFSSRCGSAPAAPTALGKESDLRACKSPSRMQRAFSASPTSEQRHGERSPAMARMNVPRSLQVKASTPSHLHARRSPAPGGHRAPRATRAGSDDPQARIAEAAAKAEEVAAAEAARRAKAATERAKAEAAAKETATEVGPSRARGATDSEEESSERTGSRVSLDESESEETSSDGKGSLLSKIKKRALISSKVTKEEEEVSQEDVERFMAEAAPSLPVHLSQQKMASRVSYGSIQVPKTTTSTKSKRNRSRRGPRPTPKTALAATQASTESPTTAAAV